MNFIHKLIFISLFHISFLSLSAQPTPSVDSIPETLSVGVYHAPPFMIKSEQGMWDGISIDLWRHVADELNITYELVETSGDTVLSQIEKGTVDIALAENANSEDGDWVDFSQIYYISYIGVVSDATTQSLMNIFKGIFSQRFFQIVLFISILLLIVGTAIWLIERTSNEDHFGGERRFWHGIGSGFWWAGVTMTTIGYGDKAPVTFWGRAVALIWMLVAMAVTSSLTAAVVSAVGGGQNGFVQIPNDLKDMEVGSIAHSPSADYLNQHQIDFQDFDAPQEAVDALKKREIGAFVYNVASLQYLSKENQSLHSRVQPTQLNPRFFAFAFQKDHPLKEALNQKLLIKLNDDSWPALLNRYMPQE